MKKVIFLLLLAVLGSSSMRASEYGVLCDEMHHLGDVPLEVWQQIDEFASESPSLGTYAISSEEDMAIDPYGNMAGTHYFRTTPTLLGMAVRNLGDYSSTFLNPPPTERDYRLMRRLNLKGELRRTTYTNNRRSGGNSIAFLQSDNNLETYDDLHIVDITNTEEPKLLDTLTMNPEDRFYVSNEQQIH